MVRARADFLAGGYFRPVAEAMAAAVAAAPPGGVLAEIGSGTGYYLAAAAEALARHGAGAGCAVGFDLSKAAADHAAKRHPGLEFVVADVEAGIPLQTAAAGAAISVFAPRPAVELARVVRPGGAFVAAFASPRHLERLRGRLRLMGVHDDKLGRLSARLEPEFETLSTETVEYEIQLGVEDARRLVLMGPNAWHGAELGGLGAGHEDVVSVVVVRYRRR
jgi:23S rRNA (guanine745-N1)-methyltransferase